MKFALPIILAVMATLSISTQVAGTSVPAPILGFERIAEGFRFQVVSTGCTQAEHFRLDTRALDTGELEVTLVRLKTDRCRRMPMKFFVTMNLADTQVPVIVTNPVVLLKTPDRQG